MIKLRKGLGRSDIRPLKDYRDGRGTCVKAPGPDPDDLIHKFRLEKVRSALGKHLRRQILRALTAHKKDRLSNC